MTAPTAITCDWCDQEATRVTAYGQLEPMCNACARMNFGDDWRADTRVLGVRARKALETR